MVEPINMQVMAGRVDDVAKINKSIEQSLMGQQGNAQKDMAKNVEKEMHTITESQHSEKKTIEKDNEHKNEYQKQVLLKKKKKQEEEKEKKPLVKDPDRGRILDIEI